MSDRNKRNNSRYGAWLAGLSRGKRVCWRLFQMAAVVCAVLGVLWLAYSLFVREPDVPNLLQGKDESAGIGQMEAGERRDDVYTFLIVGKDTGGGGNTDTMILTTFDAEQKRLNALSLPRDTMTNVSWNNKKLNTVYNFNKGKDKQTQVEKGMTALKTHMGKLTGIYPDFYIMVEWDAVGELVDAIGGVTFDVPYDMHYDDPAQDLHIHQEKGERRLNGEDAMEVIRWRKNNGEYGNFQIGDSGRMKIQQSFLLAVAKECLQLKQLMNASEFARIFTENVNTDLSAGNLVWLAQQALGMDAEQDIVFHTMPFVNYTRGTAYVIPVVDELLEIINGGLNPYTEDITAEDLEVLQIKADGSLYLTSGVLEDEALAKPPKKPAKQEKPAQPEQSGEPVQSEPEPEPEPEQPPVEQQPEQPPEQEGEQETVQPESEEPAPTEENVTQPVEQEQQTDVLPMSDTKPTQQIKSEPEDAVNVLPANPVPVE